MPNGIIPLSTQQSSALVMISRCRGRLIRSVAFLLILIASGSNAEILTRCEFVSQARGHFPDADLDKWTCIAHFESHFNTSAISSGNKDKSKDHGILQINDRFWCSPGIHNICGVSCKALRSENLTDTFECARTILSRQGFQAWSVYMKYCMNATGFIQGCGSGEMQPDGESGIEGVTTSANLPSIAASYRSSTSREPNQYIVEPCKITQRCELE
ncbi:lysozyme P-like [Galendromus occidentalis]|uniref:lysozyme n=1 Tax=Galendromus occidentalis TaxID=34638 RepID=A0AAJ7L5K4_9ACAR|nr:lysozyme P-like [Galendromus occidentalis]